MQIYRKFVLRETTEIMTTIFTTSYAFLLTTEKIIFKSFGAVARLFWKNNTSTMAPCIARPSAPMNMSMTSRKKDFTHLYQLSVQ